MQFENAYVQQSICSPTRNSFLSGRYPDKTKTWNFIDDFRTGNPDGLSCARAQPRRLSFRQLA